MPTACAWGSRQRRSRRSAGVRPSNLPKDEQAIYDFADEFLRTHTVSDATLNAAGSVLGGDRGIVDIVGTMGPYQICR